MNIRVPGHLLHFILLALLPVSCSQGEGEDVAIEVEADTAQAPDSQEFISTEGRFSITFPKGDSAVQEKVAPVPTEIGNIDMHVFMVGAGAAAYMAAYADYPAELVAGGDLPHTLDRGRDAVVTNINGELLKENDFTFQGFPAKEFYVRGQQEGQDLYIRAWITMANERFYQVLYLTVDEASLDSQAADDYVASFRIDEDAAADAGTTDEAAAEDATADEGEETEGGAEVDAETSSRP